MKRTTLSREIDAAPAAVWAVLIDVSHLPDISPSTVHIDAPPRLQRVGDAFDQTVKLGGKRFTSTWKVTEFDEESRLTVAGSVLPGTHYSMIEELEKAGEGRTTMTLTIDYSLPLGPLGRLAGRLGAERRALGEARQVLDGVAALAEASPTSASASASRRRRS